MSNTIIHVVIFLPQEETSSAQSLHMENGKIFLLGLFSDGGESS